MSIEVNAPETYLSLVALDTIYATIDSSGAIQYAIDEDPSSNFIWDTLETALTTITTSRQELHWWGEDSDGNIDWIKKYRRSTEASEIENSFSQISEAMVDVSTKNIESRLQHPYFEKDLSALRFNSPIAVAYTISMLKMEKVRNNISDALDAEYSFTARSQEFGDFQEGIRAAVIDKDRTPLWKNKNLGEVSDEDLKPFFQTIHR